MFFLLKCTKFLFRLGSTPDIVGSLQRSPNPLSGFGVRGREREGRERRGRKEGRKGGRIEGEKGKGEGEGIYKEEIF